MVQRNDNTLLYKVKQEGIKFLVYKSNIKTFLTLSLWGVNNIGMLSFFE